MRRPDVAADEYKETQGRGRWLSRDGCLAPGTTTTTLRLARVKTAAKMVFKPQKSRLVPLTSTRRSFHIPGATRHLPPDKEFHAEHIVIQLKIDLEKKRIGGTCTTKL